MLFDTQIQQPATPDSRVFPSVAELADLYVDAIGRGWVELDRSSPHFLDFIISRVPEDQWFPILSL